MNISAYIPTIKSKTVSGLLLVILAFLLLIFFFLKGYSFSGNSLYYGIALLPFVVKIEFENFSIRYFFPLITILFIGYFIPLSTVYYITIVLGLLLSIELLFGKVNSATLFHLLILSPVFNYLNIFLGFPIKLKLSELSGLILKNVGYHAETLGNIILLNGKEFSVDTACMGLKMLSLSLLLSLVIIAHFEKCLSIKPRFFNTIIILALTILLNIVCNLFRILVLVIFEIPGSSIFHDIAGLVSLVFYVILPLVFLTPLILRMIPNKEKTTSFLISRNFKLGIAGISYGVIICSGIYISKEKSSSTLIPEVYNIQGYKKTLCTKDVLKFENSNAMIYVKPVKSFYGAEHNPMICWIGSGYEISQIKKTRLDKMEIYTGILKRKNEIIYSSWWFDNGKERTIEQSNWRWQVFKGEQNFSLINVNTTSKEKLNEETRKILKLNILKK